MSTLHDSAELFQVGAKVFLEIPSIAGESEAFAVITSVQGGVVLAELPSLVVADQLRKAGSQELSVSTYGNSGYYRCVATVPPGGSGRTVLLRIEQVLQAAPQRRQDPRADLELPLYLRSLSWSSAEAARRFWQEQQQFRAGCRPPLLRRDGDSYYIDGWEEWRKLPSQPLNISASGIMFHCGWQMQPSTRFYADLFLPYTPCHVVSVVGRVLRQERLTPGALPADQLVQVQRAIKSDAVYRAAAVFESISEADRQLLGDLVAEFIME